MTRWRGWIVLMSALLVAGSAYSQPAPGANLGHMLKYMFGENRSFTAKQEVKMEGTQHVSLKGSIAMLDGNMRSEMELAEMMAPEGREKLAQVLSKSYQITRFDKKAFYLVYPGLKSYVEIPIPAPALAVLEKPPKIEKTEVGNETIDGHACVKNKLVITGEGDAMHELAVWNATDLDGFPLQFQIKVGENTVTTSFTEVKLDKPDAKLFEPSADMEKCKSIVEVMQKAVANETPTETPKR